MGSVFLQNLWQPFPCTWADPWPPYMLLSSGRGPAASDPSCPWCPMAPPRGIVTGATRGSRTRLPTVHRCGDGAHCNHGYLRRSLGGIWEWHWDLAGCGRDLEQNEMNWYMRNLISVHETKLCGIPKFWRKPSQLPFSTLQKQDIKCLAMSILRHWGQDKIADDIFKCIFFNENVWIRLISLQYFPMGPIDIKPALVQVMTWCQTGDKPLSELTI